MLTVILIIVFFVILLYIAICFFISNTVLYLDRQLVPKTPKNYGLDFQNIEFETLDKVKIKGWLIPGSSDKLIVVTHVGGLTKYGSTKQFKSLTKLYNKEIEFLKVAQHLHNEGYWVLTFDLRNHGESGEGPNGGKATVGLDEALDVIAAMKYIANSPETRDKKVGFVSFCMGANSTIIAMSKDPVAFKNVKCMVAVQPISMEVFIRTYAKIIFTPLGAKLLLPLIKQFVAWRGKYRIEEMSPRDYVKDIRVPTMYVQTRNDPWTEASDIYGFYENTPTQKEFLWLEGLTHRFQGYQYFGEHPEKMLEWLKKWM